MRVLSVLRKARIALFHPDKRSAPATPLHPAGTAPPPPNFGFEKAQALARANVTELALKISVFRLTENERFELAKIAAAHDGWHTSMLIRDFGITDQAQLFEVAKIAAAQSGASTSIYIRNYGLQDEALRFAVAKIAAAQSGEGTSFSIQNYKIAESSRRLEVARIALSSDARVLRYLSRYSLGIDDFNLACEFSPESFVDYARAQLRKLKINPEFAGCLFLASRSREVAARLFIQLMQEDNEVLSKIPRPATNLPRYLLAKTIGLDPLLLYDREFSSRVAGAFFELCVSLREGFRRPYFERVKLAPELFDDRQLDAIMLFLKGLERLANILDGRLAKHLDRLINALAAWSGGGESINLTAENIKALTARINRYFSRLFGQVFQIDGGSIAPDNIRRLEEAWGSIDVLYALITRYKKRVDCQQEIPVLARIVSCVLDGTFRELKYHGDPADVDDQAMAAAQLAMLEGEEARQGWMGNYQRIAVFKANNNAAPATDEELVERSRQFLKDQVVGHVREWIVPASAVAHQRTMEELLSDPSLAKNKGPAAVILGCLELLQDVITMAEYKKYLSLLRWAARHLDMPEQISNDIRTLNDLLAYRETGREAIVFTSTTDDPKLLLLSGSLVDVSSCLDVQTGQYIDALLGYVIDANLKLVLSYGLQENDFKSPGEYAVAKRAIEAGAQAEFIPAKHQLRIGEIEVDLPKARIRKVVKLGATESQSAGIRTERAYAQNYFAEREMASQVKSILDELAAKSKAKLGEKIRIPPSRNPGGVYSDAANGAQTESYAIG